MLLVFVFLNTEIANFLNYNDVISIDNPEDLRSDNKSCHPKKDEPAMYLRIVNYLVDDIPTYNQNDGSKRARCGVTPMVFSDHTADAIIIHPLPYVNFQNRAL